MGKLHRAFLFKYNQALFTILLSEERLYSYLANIDRQAEEMFYRFVNQIAEHEGVAKQMKEENQMLWVQKKLYAESKE